MKLIVLVDWADNLTEWPKKTQCTKEGEARFKRIMKYFEAWRLKQRREYRLVLWHTHYPGRFLPPTQMPDDGAIPFDGRPNLFGKQLEAIAKNVTPDEPILLADDSFFFADDFDLEPFIEGSKKTPERIIPVGGAWLLSPQMQQFFAARGDSAARSEPTESAESGDKVAFEDADWTEADFLAWAERTNWIFAETYAKTAPHEYAVRPRSNTTLEELYHATMFILRNGFVQMFYQTPFMAYQVANRRYWSCGGYDLINRTLEGDLKVYK